MLPKLASREQISNPREKKNQRCDCERSDLNDYGPSPVQLASKYFGVGGELGNSCTEH